MINTPIRYFWLVLALELIAYALIFYFFGTQTALFVAAFDIASLSLVQHFHFLGYFSTSS